MPAYYQTEDLPKLADLSLGAPALWEAFQAYYAGALGAGALTEREKSLIALAVSHALQCPYCIDVSTRRGVERGASPAEMTEAIHVAAAIRAGATLSHAVQMQEAAGRLSS